MDEAVKRPAVRDIMEEAGARSISRESPPRTDVGTLTLHWVTAIAFIVSLFTGVRIAADALKAPVSKWLSPVLPQGEIWSWHFLAGLTLFFCASAYIVYVMRSGLAPRNSLKKTRVLRMPAPASMKWGAVNVALHWFVYALIAFLTGTGAVLYLGYGGWWVYLHSTAAFVGLGYIFAHVLAHYLQGGWWQVFRVFRPQRLALTKAVRPKPLLIALGVGVLFAALVAGLDWLTRDTLVVAHVSKGPRLEALLDDPVWARARPVFIQTQQGANLGGTGESSSRCVPCTMATRSISPSVGRTRRAPCAASRSSSGRMAGTRSTRIPRIRTPLIFTRTRSPSSSPTIPHSAVLVRLRSGPIRFRPTSPRL